MPTKSRSKFFASDLRITFGIHVFWAQQCATGIRLAKNGPEECQIQYFLLIFSVFWPPFSGYSAPCGFTSGHEREPHYASKSFTEVVFKVNRSRVIRHSLTFLFGKSSTKRPLARARIFSTIVIAIGVASHVLDSIVAATVARAGAPVITGRWNNY